MLNYSFNKKHSITRSLDRTKFSLICEETVPWAALYRENTWMFPPPVLQTAAAASSWLSHSQKQWGCAAEAAGKARSPSCTPVSASGSSAAVCSTAPPATCWRRRASGTAGLTLSWSAERHGRDAWRSEGAAMPTQTGKYNNSFNYSSQPEKKQLLRTEEFFNTTWNLIQEQYKWK